MRVRFTPRARDDLEAIIDYLSNQSPSGAGNIKRTLDATVEVIGSFPDSGRLAGESGARVLPVARYPYLVYWVVEGDEAWIVHIRDGRRKPWRAGRKD